VTKIFNKKVFWGDTGSMFFAQEFKEPLLMGLHKYQNHH